MQNLRRYYPTVNAGYFKDTLPNFWWVSYVESLCYADVGSLNFNIFGSYESQATLKEPLLNPFIPNAPFLYPLKTSENRKVFWCFQGVEKGYIRNKWVKFWWVSNIVLMKVFARIYLP